jgi:hypothetical protein
VFSLFLRPEPRRSPRARSRTNVRSD